jgi:hypothetical protein
MKKKTTTKLKPQSKREKPKPKDEVVLDTLSFHETFPLTLVHKDGKDEKVCFFVCKEHLDKYISRYKLNKKDYKISKTEPRKTENG